MSSTYLPTTNGQPSIDFAPGTIIDARGQIGVIVDVLRSATTQNVVLYVRFVHNIGNARQHDALELTPERITALGRGQVATGNGGAATGSRGQAPAVVGTGIDGNY